MTAVAPTPYPTFGVSGFDGDSWRSHPRPRDHDIKHPMADRASTAGRQWVAGRPKTACGQCKNQKASEPLFVESRLTRLTVFSYAAPVTNPSAKGVHD